MNKEKQTAQTSTATVVICPQCHTDDYDVTEDGKEGFCIVGCGAWFSIDGKSTKIIGDCSKLIVGI